MVGGDVGSVRVIYVFFFLGFYRWLELIEDAAPEDCPLKRYEREECSMWQVRISRQLVAPSRMWRRACAEPASSHVWDNGCGNPCVCAELSYRTHLPIPTIARLWIGNLG